MHERALTDVDILATIRHWEHIVLRGNAKRRVYWGHDTKRLAANLVKQRRHRKFLIMRQDRLVTKVFGASQGEQLSTQPVLDLRVLCQQK